MLIPKEKSNRSKLTDQQRKEIFDNVNYESVNQLAKDYRVSRRTIQFIQSPKLLAENIKLKSKRDKKKKLSSIELEEQKEKRKIYMQTYRNRIKLLKKGEL